MSDLTFTTIEESARAELGLSRDEYALCNYVQTWSSYPSNKRPGYCGSTKGQMAVFIGISPRGIMKMLDRMERVELIERLSETLFFHRITKRWFDIVTIAKAVRKGEQSSSLGDNRKENKVPLRGEQSSSLGENKVLPPKEVNNKEVKERDAPAEIQPSNLKEGKKEKTPLVAPPPSFPPGPLANLTDAEVNELVERSRREDGELYLKISQSTAPLRYDQYPRPTNAKELREAMSAYFKDNPHEWSDGVLEEGRARNWNPEKIKSCVQEFCLHQEKTDNLKQKYSQYKAALTIWFRREERFNASVPAQGNGYSQKNEPSVIPSNIQRFK